MLLSVLVALPAAVGPLLRGSWDPWAQTLVVGGCAAGFAVWMAVRVSAGFIPLPSRRSLAWVAGVALLGGLSARWAPLGGAMPFEWPTLLVGLWLFTAVSVMSKDERELVDQAVRVAAWVLMALAFYQHWRLADARPPSALLNANCWAGTILMLLPLSIDRRDWLLAAGLVLCLWWTRSVGAWLALFAALLLTGPWRAETRTWAALGGALVCLVAVYNKFQSPAVLDRLTWWRAAAMMAWTRPGLGFGPGAFALALPGFSARGLGSLYAHEYPLETAASYGVPFALLWFTGLWRQLLRARTYKRFAALTVLFQSLWDWPLSVPGNLWLFCYLAASASPETADGAGVPWRWKAPLAGASLAVGLWCVWAMGGLFAVDRTKAMAAAALGDGRAAQAEELARDAARRAPRDPDAPLIAAEAELAQAAGGSEPATALARAAESFEAALAIDPYRPRAWVELSLVYGKLGDAARAASARRRGARACPSLRGGAA